MLSYIKSKNPRKNITCIAGETTKSTEILRVSVSVEGIMSLPLNFTGKLCLYVSLRNTEFTMLG